MELKDNKVSERAIESFYRAIRRSEQIVASRRPDLLIGPLRGSEPIIESMRVIAELEHRELPAVIYVETGCIDSVLKDNQRFDPRPLNDEQKVDIVRKRLEPHIQKYGGQFRLCLVDEVERGGSIVKNFDYVNGALRIFYHEKDFRLEAIAICGPQEKCGRFKQLQDMRRIIPLYVEDLFTVDRTIYLSPLVRTGDNVEQLGTYPKDLKSRLYGEVSRLHRVA